jgi:hypothetical protein
LPFKAPGQQPEPILRLHFQPVHAAGQCQFFDFVVMTATSLTAVFEANALHQEPADFRFETPVRARVGAGGREVVQWLVQIGSLRSMWETLSRSYRLPRGGEPQSYAEAMLDSPTIEQPTSPVILVWCRRRAPLTFE